MTNVPPAPAATRRPKDTLGCVSSKLRKYIELDIGDIRFYRKCMDDANLDRVAMPASDRGFLVGISLNNGHRRRIFNGRRVIAKEFDTDSIYIRDFSEDYQADLYGNFDFVLVELSQAFFPASATKRAGRVSADSLARLDKRTLFSVISHARWPDMSSSSMRSTRCSSSRWASCSALAFRSATAICAPKACAQRVRCPGLTKRCGTADATFAARRIDCRRRERMQSVARLLHPRLFTRDGTHASSMAAGATVAQARQLIEATDVTLAEIAMSCGFADQSHLSRVFLKTIGTSPGAWRRAAAR